MICYSLADFNAILKNCVISELPEETINIINALSAQVGAPEYIKTPQFRNKVIGSSNSNSTNNGIRRRKKNFEVHDDEWESIRTFQTTELKKKEGIECNLFTVRKYLNMITFNTYDKLKGEILTEINVVKSTKTLNDLQYLCTEIFYIISGNILYSDIYAKLYKDLIQDFDIFKEILMENFSTLEERFNNVEYYEPEEDYDKFCENNKKNEKLRAICTFYVNLMKEEIIDKLLIKQTILQLFNILNNMISDGTKKNELDELSELLYIIITNSYELIKNDDPTSAEQIHDNIVKITKLKVKDTPGITNKCIFKHMDVLDEISN